MAELSRRRFIELAASFGASLAWGTVDTRVSEVVWQERKNFYPQGVASGDPNPDSVILWTRRPPSEGSDARKLIAEIADDLDFRHVVARAEAPLSGDTDWTCRILAAGLRPGSLYWYRFTDDRGLGSRIGRTRTAPLATDERDVSFAFVSCQNVQQGASNAYRRMIYEDERASVDQQLGFVLHLGDFVYEVVWYPEDRPQGMYARRLRDIVRYKSGEKIGDLHVPTTVDDYRALYRAYLLDPDLQDARARWPFICMWDNHEFSWKGWQSQQNFGGVKPAQTRKVAANQAWFEYQPARVVKPGTSSLDRFDAPAVNDREIRSFDDHGLGLEPGNLRAIESLKLCRTLRWGRHVDLILTDNRSFRTEPVMQSAEAAAFEVKGFPAVFSQSVVEVLDAGREYNDRRPPNAIKFNGAELINPRRNGSPQSMLGAKQKTWFIQQLRASSATWKVWGNSVAMLDWRTDFQNLPENLGVRWPVTGYAQFADDDWSAYRWERASILEFVRQQQIRGLVSLAGDRHAFMAGLLSRSLEPQRFEPVAVEFVTGSISAPGLFEALEYRLPPDHPLRPIYLYKPKNVGPVEPAMNLSMMHGVRSSVALQRTGDLSKAWEERNAELAPHLSFVDAGGHGYAVVHARKEELEVEFVCVPRPLEPSGRPDGGPLAYRVKHRVKSWAAGSPPQLKQTIVEGTPPLIL